MVVMMFPLINILYWNSDLYTFNFQCGNIDVSKLGWWPKLGNNFTSSVNQVLYFKHPQNYWRKENICNVSYTATGWTRRRLDVNSGYAGHIPNVDLRCVWRVNTLIKTNPSVVFVINTAKNNWNLWLVSFLATAESCYMYQGLVSDK